MRKNCKAMLLFVRAKCSCEPDFKTKNERVKKEVDGEQEDKNQENLVFEG